MMTHNYHERAPISEYWGFTDIINRSHKAIKARNWAFLEIPIKPRTDDRNEAEFLGPKNM